VYFGAEVSPLEKRPIGRRLSFEIGTGHGCMGVSSPDRRGGRWKKDNERKNAGEESFMRKLRTVRMMAPKTWCSHGRKKDDPNGSRGRHRGQKNNLGTQDGAQAEEDFTGHQKTQRGPRSGKGRGGWEGRTHTIVRDVPGRVHRDSDEGDTRVKNESRGSARFLRKIGSQLGGRNGTCRRKGGELGGRCRPCGTSQPKTAKVL